MGEAKKEEQHILEVLGGSKWAPRELNQIIDWLTRESHHPITCADFGGRERRLMILVGCPLGELEVIRSKLYLKLAAELAVEEGLRLETAPTGP